MEQMRPLTFEQLMTRALSEYRTYGSVFGVRELYRPISGKTLPIFGGLIETPFGPAAGPHTQLAQNIVAAYVAGARFFELKTVQRIDGEDMAKCIARPCINAAEEGYNVEWSTELTVAQALGEYVKAYFALKLLSREWELGSPDGFQFNMSVGYDLEGIQSEKVDQFITSLQDVSQTAAWQLARSWTMAHLSSFMRVDQAYVESLSPDVCRSITLSTLHGCPPAEIERIAVYLISVKGLHTFIKCNPTLLGYDFARKTMNDMGYSEISFDDHHFKGDLQYTDAVPMLRRLMALAKEKNVEFGVKLTNTFPVDIKKGELPGDEMYMSGKALFPLSIALAAKLEADFGGQLRVSYSGGADALNIRDIFRCGIWPITVATTLLKPGGYNRFRQMAQLFEEETYAPFSSTDVEGLEVLAQSAREDTRYKRSARHAQNRKLNRKAPLIDCFIADCSENCPLHQDIPAYLNLVEKGRYEEALRVICERNPLPFITGTICAHRCQSACTRQFIDTPMDIRDAKLLAAHNGMDAYLASLHPPKNGNGQTVAVVGGGPAGMAAAFFAARAGARVTLFEKRESLGGVVRHVIPEFRIASDAIDSDAAMLDKLNVEVKLKAPVLDAAKLSVFDHVIVATGAWKHSPLRLEEGEALNALEFLENAKKDPSRTGVTGHVVIVGGGNTAMDAARAALRLPGVVSVTIVYRRTVAQMPAELEELELATREGVLFRELLSPRTLVDRKLCCDEMCLGAPGADGRRKPEPTGATVSLEADVLIAAIGEQAEPTDVFGTQALVIGDAKRGPATVAEAIADAYEAVQSFCPDMLTDHKIPDPPTAKRLASLKARRAALLKPCEDCAAERCLGCNTVCETCVDVCPNRANVVIRASGREEVLHLDELCNECGNCAVFCPYSGEPYHDKLTLFTDPAAFSHSNNQGFMPVGDGLYRMRFGDNRDFEATLSDLRVPAEVAGIIRTIEKDYDYLIKQEF